MASPTHSDRNFWALSTMYLEQLKVLILSLLYFWWSTKDIMIDFPKKSLSAYIEVKTFKSSGMSSSSVSLDNWSINSSDCPGAIASANVFSSYCLNQINLPFKSLLVFSLNSSTFFVWFDIELDWRTTTTLSIPYNITWQYDFFWVLIRIFWGPLLHWWLGWTYAGCCKTCRVAS